MAKRIGVASPHPLLLALHGNGLKASHFSISVLLSPQFCCSCPGKHTVTSRFWLRSSHGSSNPNHSKKQSSRVKSSKARGRGAQERLRYSTDKAVGHLHSSVALPHDQGFPTALAAPRMQFFLLCQYNRLPESRRQLQPYKDA